MRFNKETQYKHLEQLTQTLLSALLCFNNMNFPRHHNSEKHAFMFTCLINLTRRQREKNFSKKLRNDFYAQKFVTRKIDYNGISEWSVLKY